MMNKYYIEKKIPEGYNARIEGNKVILERKESEDERIRKELISYLTDIIDSICGEEDIPHDAKILGGKIRHWVAYLEKQKERKPTEWSKEDKKILDELLNHCNTENATWYNWLKSLRPQPKQEWSEEDETALGDLMWCIEQAKKSAKDENDMGNIWFAENWIKKRIKSLCLQPHWKPSEEQMQALWEVEGRMRTNKAFTLSNKLASLYNDLKKL